MRAITPFGRVFNGDVCTAVLFCYSLTGGYVDLAIMKVVCVHGSVVFIIS